MEDRGTGRTTRQLKNASAGAIFIWVNSNIDYPKTICREIGREDIEVVAPSWIESDRWRGRVFTEIILDHATTLTARQYDFFYKIRSCNKIK